VGVGPSDPDLVTERALAVLRAADRVYAPSTSTESVSRAEAVVRAAAPEVGVDRLVIEIGADEAARHASISAGAEALLADLDQGHLVALVVLGDPNVYSVFTRVAALVHRERPDLPVTTVPGIMGFQELAARTGTVLVEGDEQLSVLTLGPEAAPIQPLLDDDGRTVVVYKGGRHLPEVAEVAAAKDRAATAVVGEMLGLPGGRSVALADAAERPGTYLATVVLPARRENGTP
jgi:precorrin-2/cobalt-factor-2 C20-methyltransferase